MTRPHLPIGAGLLLVVAALPSAGTTAPQQPTFRTATDVIAVDVQVINRQGLPCSAWTWVGWRYLGVTLRSAK